MGEVHDLSAYAFSRRLGEATESPQIGQFRFYEEPIYATEGSVSSRALYGDIDPEFSRFIEVMTITQRTLAQAQSALDEGEKIAADDNFMIAKDQLFELFMFRELSDAVGVIVSKCLQAAANVLVISDYPALPSTMLRALKRAEHAPFMTFEEGCTIAAAIEEASFEFLPPAFKELTTTLAEDPEKIDDDRGLHRNNGVD